MVMISHSYYDDHYNLYDHDDPDEYNDHDTL